MEIDRPKATIVRRQFKPGGSAKAGVAPKPASTIRPIRSAAQKELAPVQLAQTKLYLPKVQTGVPSELKFLTALAVAAAIGVGGYYAADPIARKIVGNFKGQAPTEPTPVTVDPEPRGPLHYLTAVDVSCSAIKKDEPAVVSSLAESLKTQTIFKPGDLVTVCSFAEVPICKTFDMGTKCDNANPDNVCKYITDIKPDCSRGAKQLTFVHRVAETVTTDQFEKNAQRDPYKKYAGLVSIWSDYKEEDPNKNWVPLQPNHPELIMAFPSTKYALDCEKSRERLGTAGVNCMHAADAKDMSKLIERKAKKMDADQKAKADARAKVKNDELKGQFEGQKAKFAADIKAFNDKKAATLAKVEKTKRGIRIGFGGFAAGLLGLVTLTGLSEKLPRLKGYIVNTNKQYAETHLLSGKSKKALKKIVADAPEGIVLAPSLRGVTVKDRPLFDGEELAPGIFYYFNQPDNKTLLSLKKGSKKDDAPRFKSL